MIQTEGVLFEAVQNTAVFPDSKTFVDAIPKINPAEILENYQIQKNTPDFDLKKFINEYFYIPKPVASSADKIKHDSIETYIESLWEVLKRDADESVPYDTRIPLAYPYIVPGGRFREIYYWDSYFTAEGLAVVDRYEIIESMIKNFIYLQEKLGLIPNGNRIYFATRSQPPVLGLMIDLLYQKYGIEHIKNYIPALEKEYKTWMEGSDTLNEVNPVYHKVVRMPDGSILNRYCDKGDMPRQEAYKEDIKLAQDLNEKDAKLLFKNLRTGAESGWDFSSRWLKDPYRLETIQILAIIPVDLNALLFGIEKLLAKYFAELKQSDKANFYQIQAEKRKQAINHYCWDSNKKFFFDYNFVVKEKTAIYSMAGAVPLFVQMAAKEQADAVAAILQTKMLKKGGFVSTLIDNGQQWDSPNGWAPLQWFGVKGLLNYGKEQLAIEAMQRWIKTVHVHFAKTKMLMEKYDVCNPEKIAEGGEYTVQEGFGWTNGIALKFLELLS